MFNMRMRPVILDWGGLVACHLKVQSANQTELGSNEPGENSLFCLHLQKEAEERTWKYTLPQFFDFKPLIYHLRCTNTLVNPRKV